MPEITHVVVQVERHSDNPANLLLVAEAGYANVDDVIAVVEHGPVSPDPHDPMAPALGDVIELLQKLAAAIRGEPESKWTSRISVIASSSTTPG